MMDGEPPSARGPGRDGNAGAEEAGAGRAPAHGLIGAHVTAGRDERPQHHDRLGPVELCEL